MPVIIDGYEIDAALSEDHESDAEITDNPVEKGPDTTDHVRLKPKQVTIEGIVSDTPFGELALRRESNGQFIPGDKGALPSTDARITLEEIQNRREPVTIETNLKTYDNMVLQSFTPSVTSETGDSLQFRAVFRELIITTNERTTVKVATPRCGKKAGLGNKPTIEIDEVSVKSIPEAAKDRRSILLKGVQSLGDLLQ